MMLTRFGAGFALATALGFLAFFAGFFGDGMGALYADFMRVASHFRGGCWSRLKIIREIFVALTLIMITMRTV